MKIVTLDRIIEIFGFEINPLIDLTLMEQAVLTILGNIFIIILIFIVVSLLIKIITRLIRGY